MEWDDRYNSKAWDSAYRRTEAYLSALQIRNKLLVSRLVNWVMEQTAERCSGNPNLSPETEACKIVDGMVDNWFEKSLGNTHDQPPPEVRLALLSSENPLQWQRYFLQDSELPPRVLSRLRQSLVDAGPEFEPINMHPRPVEFGRFNQMAETALVGLDRRPRLRFIVVWALAFLFFGTLFSITR